jgi:hypothetical protein
LFVVATGVGSEKLGWKLDLSSLSCVPNALTGCTILPFLRLNHLSFRNSLIKYFNISSATQGAAGKSGGGRTAREIATMSEVVSACFASAYISTFNESLLASFAVTWLSGVPSVGACTESHAGQKTQTSQHWHPRSLNHTAPSCYTSRVRLLPRLPPFWWQLRRGHK